MNILTDGIHHADLAFSLVLLGNRLGARVFFPFGLDWFDKGYFSIYGDLRKREPYRYLAKKYLKDNYYPSDPALGYILVTKETYNGCDDYPIPNLLMLDYAKNIQIDIIICTLHENEESFAKLKELWPNAKFLRQCGNDLDTNVNESLYPNLLSAAKQPYEAFKGHKVLAKEEWDINLSQYVAPTNFNNIYSFQNNLEAFEDTWEVWVRLKHELRDFKFKSYGNENDDGKIYPKREYYQKMSESTFGFQSKGPYEGYGFTIHNSIYLGRPVIIRFKDYQGKMAEPLLKEGVSYLEMDDPNLAYKIKFYSEPERFRKMSQECREMWHNIPSFDEEFNERIKPFFENLI